MSTPSIDCPTVKALSLAYFSDGFQCIHHFVRPVEIHSRARENILAGPLRGENF